MAWEEASLATNLVAATPTLAGTPTRWRIWERIQVATWTGVPMRRLAPDTSRKASSILTCSSRGVTSARTSMTRADTAP